MRLRGRLTLLALAGLPLLLLWRGGSDASSGHPPHVSAPGATAATPSPGSILTRLGPLPPGADGSSLENGAEQDGRFVATVPFEPPQGSFRIEYTVHPELSRRVQAILRRGRVSLGHVIVLEPASGRVLAYVSTDPKRLPGTRAYPAASLIKIVTAAAVLETAPESARRPCLFVGNPWRLTRARLDPPRSGRSASLERALATSNNQCFARWAVHGLGADALLAAMDRMGIPAPPAPGHEPGRVEPGSDALALGQLGSGLAGAWITPLGAVRLGAILDHGRLVDPRWIERVVDAEGRDVPLPPSAAAPQVLSPEIAEELRGMLVETTVSGTARRAFRTRRGPLLGDIRVAGKTGSLGGAEPRGRYEWFVGLAPADRPRLAVSTLVVQGDRWWTSASQLAAQVLKELFCVDGVCSVEAASRWTGRGDRPGSADPGA
jgi:cell division protein FtsI/penicillin-binding protein 2